MSDSKDFTNELDSYGVWVKNTPKDEQKDEFDMADTLNIPDFDGTESFDDAWNNVLADIHSASYPAGYGRQSSEGLNLNNNSIKIMKSYHNNGLVFYHIMGNFKYTGT